ncbi:hypothetical protein BDZ94DRAFT_1245494 [Collybia nuda]|uniref:Methyltransferase domain-containing protein n=1 Tax=Collybia nuda TaxID=64659 RepID=A0A9P5YGJ0_9AGAR|nr:hypothetical protein BDZ94DRAFT_1245494 [Collybia nuda]
MAAIDSFDGNNSSLLSDASPSFSSPNSSHQSETPTMEPNLSAKKSRVSNILTPPLKKRHSAYVLSPPLGSTMAAVSDIPPQRPLRNPAREGPGIATVPIEPRTRSRPSTVTGTREDITPWEFVPGPEEGESSVEAALGASGSGGSSSPLSTRTRSSLPTGAVEEVTPWELYPVQTKTTRSSLSTGLVEEVTPWELYPIPITPTTRSTLATGLVEEVTPWELYPTPKYEEPPDAPISQRHSRSYPRLSTSSQGKNLSNLAQIRRRKSTGAKAMKARSNTLPISSTSGKASTTNLTYTEAPSNIHNHTGGTASKSAPTTPKIPYKATVPSLAHPLPSLSPSVIPLQQDLKFSTADRTILEELKRNIRVRAAQFTFKGIGNTVGLVGNCGKKHHPFPMEDVPYPRSFERDVLDLDVWETAFCQDICESLTWHVFETPPSKVLDLGCGTGTWILDCARIWKGCQFVGLDVVPLHPDLQQVGSPDLAARITWVQANFLEALPFTNEEFDFVHVKRIALGVPEDKWDFLLDEISRVMKPGGAFEMLEEDLFFPGKTIDDDGLLDVKTDSELSVSQRPSHQDLFITETNGNEDRNSTLVASSRPSEIFGETPRMTPTTSSFTLPGTPSRPNSPAAGISPTDEDASDEARELLAQVYVNYSAGLQPSKRANQVTSLSPEPVARPLLHSKPPVTHSPHPQSRIAGSALSLLMSSVASIAPPDTMVNPVVEIKPKGRPRGYSLTVPPSSDPETGHVDPSIPHLSKNVPEIRPSPVAKSPHFLLRTFPKPPLNPRDHSLLETIYTQMLEARFINISPLALLANSLSLYFKDVRTHPPLQYAFPPVPAKIPGYRPARRNSLSDSDSGFDSDDAMDAILPSPLPRSATKRRSSRRFSTQSAESEDTNSISEDNRYLNVRGLIHHSSPYITLDESRITAFSPSTKTTFPSNTFKDGNSRRRSHLPNTTMNLDQRSLNLHLALRVAEILACSESMWEWVSGYQAENRSRKMSNPRLRARRSSSIDLPQRSATSTISSRTSTDSIRNVILELSRDEFDALLSKFDMDMRDHFALDSALRDRFGWSAMSSSPPPDRKIFENACEKWDKWEQEQRRNSHPYRSQIRSSKSHATAKTLQGRSEHTQLPDDQERSGTRGSQDNASISISSRDRPQNLRNKIISVSSRSTTLPPTHRLSRAMRVFVAWKA